MVARADEPDGKLMAFEASVGAKLDALTQRADEVARDGAATIAAIKEVNDKISAGLPSSSVASSPSDPAAIAAAVAAAIAPHIYKAGPDAKSLSLDNRAKTMGVLGTTGVHYKKWCKTIEQVCREKFGESAIKNGP